MVNSLVFPSQFLVFQIVRIDKSKNRISEKIRIVTIVETVFEFVEITVKMFFADVMKRTDD